MINGAHIVIYTKDPDADRAFFRDVLKFPSVDAGHGWSACKIRGRLEFFVRIGTRVLRGGFWFRLGGVITVDLGLAHAVGRRTLTLALLGPTPESLMRAL